MLWDNQSLVQHRECRSLAYTILQLLEHFQLFSNQVYHIYFFLDLKLSPAVIQMKLLGDAGRNCMTFWSNQERQTEYRPTEDIP